MTRLPDSIISILGTTGTILATYTGERFLAAAIAICTLIAVIPKAAVSAHKIWQWFRKWIG